MAASPSNLEFHSPVVYSKTIKNVLYAWKMKGLLPRVEVINKKCRTFPISHKATTLVSWLNFNVVANIWGKFSYIIIWVWVTWGTWAFAKLLLSLCGESSCIRLSFDEPSMDGNTTTQWVFYGTLCLRSSTLPSWLFLWLSHLPSLALLLLQNATWIRSDGKAGHFCRLKY